MSMAMGRMMNGGPESRERRLLAAGSLQETTAAVDNRIFQAGPPALNIKAFSSLFAR